MILSLLVRKMFVVLVLLAGSLVSISFATTAHASMAGDINCMVGDVLGDLPGPAGCEDDGGSNNPPTDVCPNDDGIQTTTPCPSDENTGGGGNNGGNTDGDSQSGTPSNAQNITTGGGTSLPNGGGIAPDVTGGGGNGGVGTSTPAMGTVLGTTTTSTSTEPVVPLASVNICGDQAPYLTTFMRIGQQNDTNEVQKLQTFLNMHLDLSLPVTGFFGQLTHNAVSEFQLKHSQEVLLPWVSHGLASEQTATGYVYKTTQRMINMLACEMTDLPMPQLP